MKQSDRNWLIWQLFLKNTRLKNKHLSAYLFGGLYLCFPVAVVAQSNIVPDSSLGTESSIVIPNFDGFPLELITGGAQRGQNLFHSFQEFNILEGRSAYFANPEAVTNIFSRVTGNNVSELFGTLGVAGTANLYFMNPNGIIFGQNASLDVSGSFVGTTANSIQFGEQGFFSASEPNAPPLLTVNPDAFFFNQINSGNIVNNSVAPAGVDPSGSFEVLGLRVPDGKSLSLLGGDITVDGGGVLAFGGTINLVSVAETGAVDLDLNGDTFSFSVSELARGDISIVNNAGLLALGNGGGDINLTGNNIAIDNSLVETGIASDLGSATIQAGNITFDASGDITLDNNSFVFNRVRTTSTGNSGDISVNANNLTLNNSSQLSLLVFGLGDTGNIEINTTDSITLNGSGDLSVATGIFNNVNNLATGNVGEVNIATENLSINNAAGIGTSNFGQGNSGDLEITANSVLLNNALLDASSFSQGNSGNINIEGTNFIEINTSTIFASVGQDSAGNAGNISLESAQNIDLNGSFIEANIQPNTVGNAGTIKLEGNSISLTEGSFLQSGFFAGGQGEPGSISLEANDSIIFDLAGIFGDVQPGAIANSSNINLVAENLVSFSNNSFINTSNGTQNNSGDVDIIANSIAFDSSFINTGNLSAGNGGDVSLVADGLISFSNNGAIDVSGNNGGNINISADSLELLNSSQWVTTIPEGLGDSEAQTGEIKIDVSQLLISDNSLISNQIGTGAIGNNGDIAISADELDIVNNSIISNINFGQGNTGNISVESSVTKLDNDSNLIVNKIGEGNTGNITVDTGFVELNNSSEFFTFGNLGNITITATENVSLSNESFILNSLQSQTTGNTGNIQINAKNLDLINSSLINSVNGMGNAGLIEINSTEAFNLKDNSRIRSEVTVFGIGNGGNINIAARDIFLTDNSLITTGVASNGNAGNITLQAENTFSASNSSFINSNIGTSDGDFATGNVGNILIRAKDISLSDNAQVQSGLFSNAIGEPGTISLQAEDSLSIVGTSNTSTSNTGIFANTEDNSVGNGSDIQLSATSILFDNGAVAQASSRGDGTGGNVSIDSDVLSLDNSSLISASTFGRGDAGNIKITTGSLTANNAAKISAATAPNSSGNGGNIDIGASDFIRLSGTVITPDTFVESGINAQVRGSGNGGNINLTTANLTIEEGAVVEANTLDPNSGKGGNIDINAFNSIELIGGTELTPSSISVDTSSSEDAGNLNIKTNQLIVRDGGQISSTTFGEGDAGNLKVNATDIFLSGIIRAISNNPIPSGLFSSVEPEVTEDIAPDNSGNGGNLEISTARLFVLEGATIAARTLAPSKAGTIKINATDSVDLVNGSLSVIADRGAGTAGNLDLITPNLTVVDDSSISVTSLFGQAGNISIKTNNLLQSGSEITAITGISGEEEGANINLQITDLWQMRNNSQVSATAFRFADGGNVTIDTEFLVAFPESNSDITANAFAGNGGRINLTAESIFGIEAGLATPDNTTNDIDASSEFGLDGDVSIETPDVDPARGLDNLPSNLVDASRLITRNCLATGEDGKLNQFAIAGKGGFPTSPESQINSDATLSAEWLTLPDTDDFVISLEKEKSLNPEPVKEIVEATGWLMDESGQLILTANSARSQFKDFWLPNYSCANL